jgi:subtilisin family serine protease
MRVFLSYQTGDLDVARRLAESLNRERPDIEIFLAPRVLTAGAYWLPRLAEELAKADAVLFLVGRRIGPWQELEYYEAHRLARQPNRNGVPMILPVIMTEQAPGLPFFDLLHCIFASDAADRDAVAAVVAALSGAGSAGAAPPWQQFNPYKGLPALTSADAAFFFGREELTAEILDALRPNPDTIITLVGASGVGKSSVAQAGVLAALRSQLWPGDHGRPWPPELADSREWLEVTFRPGETPLKELALAFVRLIVEKGYEQDREADGWVQRFNEGAKLADLLRIVRQELNARAGSETLRQFVLYVDQGEELYSRASPSDARRFSALLAEAARHPEFHVLTSLRADYYGQLQADMALFPATRRIDIPPLRADRLELVVRRPAERLGARFDSADMPTQIAAATANEAGALPLLSYLMSDMWTAMQSRGDGVLRWAMHPELIDIAAPLRDRAERFRVRQPDKEAALRRLFTLRLAHVPREGHAVRRRARKSECAPDEWAIAETLAGSDWRLLTLNAADGAAEPTAEVAHEQLLRKWPVLGRWLEEQRDFLIWKGEIEVDRREWESLPPAERATGLLTARRLLRARQWLASRLEDIPAADREFIRESDAADLAAREKVLLDEQRLKEAELQAALQRADTARKIARRTVIGAIGVTAATGVAGFFGYRAQQSNALAREATAELDRQLQDLKNFWTQEDGAAASVDSGSTEETRVTAVDPPSTSSGRPMPTWGITAVGASASPHTGKGCVVALVGTGIDVSHPAFAGLTIVQKDFTGEGNGDAHGHDTHTAGTIFGRPVNGRRIGVAPGVTEVLVAKVLGKSGAGSIDAVLAGLQWAANHPRRPDVICTPSGYDYVMVISGRLGSDLSDEERSAAIAQGLREYLQQLRRFQGVSAVAASLGKGAVLVMPAGNNSTESGRVPVTSPSAVVQGIISVGAVAQGDNGYVVPWFSNSMPTLCAPGSEVESAYLKSSLQSLTGTSMSCAHAAGVAALWWEALRSTNPSSDVTSRMVADAMLRSARADVFAKDVAEDDRGAGLIQAPPT